MCLGRWYYKRMEPLAYLHIQMRLEGKGLVNEHLMRQLEVMPDEELPWVLIARLASGKLVAYYDEAISSDLQKELAESIFETEFSKIDSLGRVLKSHNIRFEVGHYKTYVFPSQPPKDVDVICLSKQDPKVKRFGFDGFAEKIYAIHQNDIIVSACVSAREDEKCGEAWVYTVLDYRRQGFAQKVVNAWARSLLHAGKIPFYSHKIENAASANLARKLGLQPVFEEISITQM
jgi:RimJ/RimL family protein N-acetyltransferase